MADTVHTIQIRADTTQAASSISDLQAKLANLQNIPISADVSGLQTARAEINELGQNLRTAMNPNTGKLDLSIFSQQLQKSGKTLNDYKTALLSMGTQGQQAFLSLANTIAAAEAPTNRLNKGLLKFKDTLIRTMSWQMASSMIHGVIGSFQQAVNYAEKLNTSLNNIQIVTGHSTDKMAEFAKQANTAAKRLSATTTEYTNASLIYYQQGLNDKEVAARTETTLKLANVTRQSSQIVSDQMTAIWNNFADGTSNLERYADVITALGAATAASSSEIANGLEKFASVADTVGLSYEYATSALATIVATTRQSSDTVGTGLRTLFARLESLKLGETLEDGVGLTKYSNALAAVGVNIQDQYGKIKDMDTILSELGSKWGTVSKEQQIALAQTVGGVRQYTNLIALMDNWEFFQKNLKVAQGADGTLQKQADRYATSWEAARKRVQVSAEGIYDSLIDDQAIIKVTNIWAGFLSVIDGLVASFGGLKGIIPMVSSLLMTSFAKNFPQFLTDIKSNFQVLTGRSTKNMFGIQTSLDNTLNNLIESSSDPIYKMQLQKIRDQNIMNQSFARNARRMSDADQAAYRLEMANRGYLWDASIIAAQEAEKQQQITEKLIANKVTIKSKAPSQTDINKAISEQEDMLQKITTGTSGDNQLQQMINSVQNKEIKSSITALLASRQTARQTLGEVTKKIRARETAETNLSTAQNERDAALQAYQDKVKETTAYKTIRQEAITARRRINKLNDELKDSTLSEEEKASRRAEITSLDRLVRQNQSRMSRMLSGKQKGQEGENKELDNESKKLAAAERKLTKATEKAGEARQKEKEAIKENNEAEKNMAVANQNAAKALGKPVAEAPEKAQKAFLKEAYKEAGITESARSLLEDEKLGWKFDKNGNVKTVGKALTEENLGRQLTTQEYQLVQAATRASLSKVETTARQVARYTTSKEILENNQNILDTKDVKPELLKSNIIDQIKGLRTFDSNILKDLFGSQFDKIFNLSDKEFADLGPDGIWGKIVESLGITDPKAIESVAGALKTTYEGAVKKLSGDKGLINTAEGKMNDAEREAGDKGGVTNVRGITKQIREEEATGIRSRYTGSQTSELPKLAKPSEHAAQTGMLAASTLTMAMSAVNSAANSFQTALDSSATGAQKFGALISTTASLLMSFATATRLATTVVTEDMQKKFAASAIGSTGLGKSLGMGGMIGLAISAVTLIIGLIKGGIEKREAKETEARQKAIEEANESIDRLTQSSDLIASQNNLINAYNAAAKAVTEGTATEKELQQAKQDLIASLMESTDEGYTNSNAVAAAYAGNMQGVQAAIDANRLLQIQNERASIQEGLISAGENLKKLGVKGGGVSILDNGSRTNTLYARIGAKLFGEEKMGIGYNVGASDEEIYQAYTEAVQFRNALLQVGFDPNNIEEGSKSDKLYEALTTIINNLEPAAEEYQQFQQSVEKYNIEALALGATIDSTYIGNANRAITSIESYKSYREKLIAQTASLQQYSEGTPEYEQMIKNIDAFLGTLTSVTGNELGNLQYIYTGIQNVKEYQEKYGNVGIKEEDLINAYKQYGDALFQIGTRYKLPIGLSTEDLPQELQSVLDLLKSTAEKNKIQVQLELVSSFNLGASSTPEEWAKFVKDLDEDLWIDIFKKAFNLADFAALDKDTQSAILLQYQKALNQKLYGAGGILEQNQVKLQNQLALDINTVEERNQAITKASRPIINLVNRKQFSGRAFVTAQNNLPFLEQLYEKYYDEDTKTVTKFSEDDEKKLSELGLTEINADNITYFHNLAEAVNDYNQAMANVEATNGLIEDNRAALDAYIATGFRKDLVDQAKAWGLNYDEVMKYAQALREQGIFSNEPGMDTAVYEEQRKALLAKRDTLDAEYRAGNKNEQDYLEGLAENTKALTELEKQYQTNIIASEEFAAAQMRLEAGVKSLSSNWKSWQKSLKETTKGSWESTDAFLDTREAIAGILGLDTGKITEDFIDAANAAGVLDKAAQGTKEGIAELQKFATTNLITKIFQGEESAGGIDITESETQLLGQVSTLFQNLQTLADGSEIKVGMSIDQTGALDTLQQFIIDAGMTAEQVNTALSGMGYHPKVTMQTFTVEGYAEDTATGQYNGYIKVGDTTIPVSGAIGTAANADSGHQIQVPIIDGSGTKYKGGGGGSSGGGGGGGQKKKDRKKSDTGTRYHTIRAQQANNSQNKAEANRKKERAFGAEKIAQAEKEIDLQKEAIELQKQYVDEISNYLADDRKNMITEAIKLGLNLEFDSDGVITNYREMEEELLRQENDLIDKYNAGELDDEAFQEAMKPITDFRDYWLKTYEETRDLWEEQAIALDQYIDELSDQILELTKTKIELKISIDEDELKLIDYYLEKIGDNAYKTADAISLLGSKAENSLGKMQTYYQGILDVLDPKNKLLGKNMSLEELLTMSDEDLAAADFTDAEISALREYRDNLLELQQELNQMRTEVLEKLTNAFDTFNDKVSESYEIFDHYTTVLENYRDIMDLTGRVMNRDQRKIIENLNKAILNNQRNQAESAKEIYEDSLRDVANAQKLYEEALASGDEDRIRSTKDMLDQIEAAAREKREQWLEAWQNAADTIQTIFENAIENIQNEFSEALSGSLGSIEYLQDALGRSLDTEWAYLKDFDRLYDLTKLARDVNKTLSDTRGVTNRREMLALQKEINSLLASGTQLTQYDIDALQKKYELQQAYNDLQLAKDAKSTVRLQRDQNGNWGYVYTANQDAIEEAEQNYEDKLHEYQVLNDEYISSLQQKTVDVLAEYEEKLGEIYSDTSLLPEEREARINELNKYYGDTLNLIEQQYLEAFGNQQDLLSRYLNTYDTAIDNMIDRWERTPLAQLVGMDNMAGYMTLIREEMDKIQAGIESVLGDRNGNLTAIGNPAEGIDQIIIDIGNDSSATKDEVSDLTDLLTNEFTEALAAAAAWEDEFSNKILETANNVEILSYALNGLIARLAVIRSSNIKKDDMLAAYKDAYDQHEKLVDENGVGIKDAAWEEAEKNLSDALDWFNSSAYTTQNTSAIALAKEQANIQAVGQMYAESIEDILKTLDIQSKLMNYGLNTESIPSLNNINGMTFQQEVHITAEFPNAVDHYEIEEAFNNLQNKASQFAHNQLNKTGIDF